MYERFKKIALYLDQLEESIKKLEKERDAAIKDLERHCACGDCVHNYVTPFDDCNCELGVINCNWEWRGVQDG